MMVKVSANVVLLFFVLTCLATSNPDDSGMSISDNCRSRSTEVSSFMQVFMNEDPSNANLRKSNTMLSTDQRGTHDNYERGEKANDTTNKGAATADETRQGSKERYDDKDGEFSPPSSPWWNEATCQDWLAMLSILSLSTIMGVVLVFPCGPEFMFYRNVLSESTRAAKLGDRSPYWISRADRPLYRGALVAFLLRPWPCIVTLQFLVCFLLPYGRSLPLLAGRLLVGLATSVSIFLSDRYHNGDKRQDRAEDELHWLRWDITFISCVMSAHFQLWAAHLQNRLPLTMLQVSANFHMLVVVDWVVTACVMFATRFTLSENNSQSSLTLLLLAFQFFVPFGYMVWIASHLSLPLYFSKQTTIWFTFMPGILSYALRRPKDTHEFGHHDVFHVFIVSGYLLSMIWDVYTSAWVTGATDASGVLVQSAAQWSNLWIGPLGGPTSLWR